MPCRNGRTAHLNCKILRLFDRIRSLPVIGWDTICACSWAYGTGRASVVKRIGAAGLQTKPGDLRERLNVAATSQSRDLAVD